MHGALVKCVDKCLTYFPIQQFSTILSSISLLDRNGSTSLQHMTDHMPLKKTFISPPLLPHMAGGMFYSPRWTHVLFAHSEILPIYPAVIWQSVSLISPDKPISNTNFANAVVFFKTR